MRKASVNHVAENELILYFYGEAPKADAVARHLVDCSVCRDEYARLRATLSAIDLPIPERAPDYEAQLWSTLHPRLSEESSAQKSRSFWPAAFQPRRWAISGALAAIVVAAFLAGRFTRPQPSIAPAPSPVTNASTQIPAAPDRVLMVAVGDHLDRTQMVLVELANTHAEGKVDISTERELAQNLVDENRLYRLTAQQQKDREIASVLDQVERVLIDIAHQPDSVSAKELEDLQQRIAAQGVLFKIRVVDSKVKAGNRANAQPATGNSTL
jgi:hypothetical protein